MFVFVISSRKSESRHQQLDRERADRTRRTEEWASVQFASSQHAWSDADVTPITSPRVSRPPSPRSDTEYEVTTKALSIVTQATEDSQQTAEGKTGEDICWEWGALPQAQPVEKLDVADEKTDLAQTGEVKDADKKTGQPKRELQYCT